MTAVLLLGYSFDVQPLPLEQEIVAWLRYWVCVGIADFYFESYLALVGLMPVVV